MIRDQNTLEMITNSVRQFVTEVLIPREEEVAEHDAIPETICRAYLEAVLQRARSGASKG